MKDNFNVNFDEVSKFYSKLEKLLLLQIKRFFGVTAEIIHRPKTTATKTDNNTTTTTTAGGCIAQNAPRPPNKKA